MDLFLLHNLILIWASVGAARRLTMRVADQLLIAALLGWGNIVVTSLALSALHRLGEPAWFFGSSILFALLICLLLMTLQPGLPADSSALEVKEAKPNSWLLGAFFLTIAPAACANLAVAYMYAPNNADALAYHLPRAMYYLGQGSLAHFDATDLRQICLPFNYNLLQVFALIYGAPLQCLNLFNVFAWALAGVAVYRLCRLRAFSADASLMSCWLVLIAGPVLAQAATTTPDLPAGTALLCALIFGLRWKQNLQTRHAILSGLALGLSTGSDWGTLFYVLAAGGLWLAWRCRNGRAQGLPNPRPWILSALLASALCLPFALINLAAKGHEIIRMLGILFCDPTADVTASFWSGFLPLLTKTSPLLPLNEDMVGFGLAGLLFLICAVYCAIHPRKFPGWFAWLGFGWIISHLLLRCGSYSNTRDFVPALLLMSPCVAAAIDASGAGRPALRYASCLIGLAVTLATGWSAGVYLFKNTSRPLAPMLSASFLPPAQPTLPLLLEYHLSGQSWVNVETDGTNERIFPILALGRNRHVTSSREIIPASYNLLSRSSQSHNAAYTSLGQSSSYTLLPIASKRTAGVEFLATVGTAAAARDYFGLEPNADGTAPVDSNRYLLITLDPETSLSGNQARFRIKLEGLNSNDHAHLAVDLPCDDGTTEHLATFATDGESSMTAARPFRRLDFKAVDSSTGVVIGTAAISYRPQVTEKPKPIDPAQPSSANSLFVADVVRAESSQVIASDGLLPTEGPFPQWDLPFIRWARRPSVSFTIPPIPHLSRLEVSFSVRLQVRKKAALEVLFNGKVVRYYRIDDRTTWLDQTLELTPQPGGNILEFRDAPLENEPDWLGYLESYPDVKAYLVSKHIPLEQGAREHYETNGRAEGRILHTVAKPEPAPDSYYFMFRNIRVEGFRSP